MANVRPPRPLDPGDERGSFDCGRDALNTWFRRHALANHLNGISRVNVLTSAEDGGIVAYSTLSASQIERSFLPKAQQRHRPEAIPATLLGQLAVDKLWQGQGHAVAMLLHTLKIALHASDLIGSMGVIAHPLDDGVRGFYLKWGFETLPHDPKRAMIIRTVDLRTALNAD
ncbi:GNAT superfamily N-acetyltransferase [Rhizobium sp. SG_E_25_P2]|uniref:GNAT family N-acetyltransferase n=1 Tax=Rhizobium sp. SG_E_25_P2 TaxID=2879942 RepID=UPI00247469C2|nr:GNAT family N-acetyltransferase [Rhizobium sp. SG_E_25_P2]MDH6267884.1 GNAT superfamily N-acetyltransferase [Rhizobium sp. SG_E_25_P2]